VEAVPRPEWAFPLEVGVHVESFYSAMSEQLTREVLQALCGDAQLLAFLGRHPLGRLEFSERLLDHDWLGAFVASTRELVLNSRRPADTYGREFYPRDLKSFSNAGNSLVEAMQRSLYHELGHYILDSAGPETERQVLRLLQSGRAIPISRRARRSHAEYFAETFAAYRFEPTLADKDPEGYDMVEAILRMVWKK
jgi:hypothetical protein